MFPGYRRQDRVGRAAPNVVEQRGPGGRACKPENLAGEQFQHRNGEAEDVAAWPDRLPGHLFRRGVGERHPVDRDQQTASRIKRFGDTYRGPRPSQTEVGVSALT
jgi:hypothetical protein